MSSAAAKAGSEAFRKFVLKNTRPTKVIVKSVSSPLPFCNPDNVDFVLDCAYEPPDDADHKWPWMLSSRFCNDFMVT